MKKLFLTISVVMFITACGGGGYGSSSSYNNNNNNVNNTSAAIQALVPEQIDPVQTTGGD